MTTLLTLSGSTAYHLPAPGVPPVPLAKGDLTLSLLPADPPRRAHDQLALSVGQTSFLLASNSPVRKTKSNAQHASFIFTPAPPAEGQGIGTVRIDMKDSTNPDDWEDTERKCAALEAELRARNLWEDTELFVDDENETGGPQVGPKKGWGESIAGAIMGGASSLVSKLTGRSNSQEVLPTSRGQYDGGYPPSPSVETPDESKPQHFKALAEHSWAQATIAARGIGEAAAAVGGAVGQSAKNAYDGIKDGVSERDDLPELPAKDAPKPPAKDAPKPPAKDEVDALDEPAVSQPVTAAAVKSAPVVSGRVKNVKLNEVTPITPSEPDHPVENIIPEPAKIEEKLKAADKTNKVQENPEGEPEHPVDIIVPEPTKKEELKTETKEEPKKEADKPVEDAVKDLKINDDDDVAESAKLEMEEAREEAAAIVAASDAEVKVEQEEAKEEEAAEAKDEAEAKEDDKPKTGGNGGGGGKKKNKKNKKKN